MIVLRSEDEISSMRSAGKIIKATFEVLRKRVAPGVRTVELDTVARQEILKLNGIPAFKGIRVGSRSYPANICASVNEVVVHGIPSERVLREGDIISIDIGVKFREYYADAAITVGVGRISEEANELLSVTETSLAKGIEKATVGSRLGDVSAEIQKYVEDHGFSVVRDLVGHGIGSALWEDPQIPNYGKPGTGPRLAAGMVLAIEPMVNAGTYEVETLADGWAVVTCDRKLSAHFEHTIVIREGGAEILTA
ncbi:MAG: type I methionyl aminopeptidase [Candidatus Omnitrophica bacterium]|nr:type I methionyl aminopeptidase [Candidatus Omnitrophota bacterium]